MSTAMAVSANGAILAQDFEDIFREHHQLKLITVESRNPSTALQSGFSPWPAYPSRSPAAHSPLEAPARTVRGQSRPDAADLADSRYSSTTAFPHKPAAHRGTAASAP